MKVDDADRVLMRTLDGFSLERLLREINAACRAWRAGELKTSIPNLQKAEPNNPIFYWMAAETARYAAWYCPALGHESRLHLPREEKFHGWETLEHILQVAVDVSLNVPHRDNWARALDEHLQGAIGQIFLRQYMLERMSPLRIGQALTMYRDALNRRYARDPNFPIEAFRSALQAALGSALEPFLFVLMQANARAWSSTPDLAHSTLVPLKHRAYDSVVGEVDERGMFKGAYEGLFRALSATPAAMHQWCREQLLPLSPDIDDLSVRFDAPNPLTRFPLVCCHPDKSDHCIAPVPHLMLEWLYEPLMDLVIRQGVAGVNRQAVAAVFEEYVGLLADLCAPDGRSWLHESDIKPKRSDAKVVDWARVFSDHVVLIDAKRSYVQPSARGRWRAKDWESIKANLCKGVEQASEFWADVKANHVSALKDKGHLKPIALIVMQGDSSFYAETEEWRDEVDVSASNPSNRIPWTLMSLHQYEMILAQWKDEDPDWLPVLLSRAAAERSAKPFVEIPIVAKGPLWDAQNRFIKEQAHKVGAESEDA